VCPSPYLDLERPPLREAALRRALEPPAGAWRAVEVVAGTGSTNADLAARARAGEEAGLVLIADHQRAGRGRLERAWTAPPRASIAVSVLLRPDGAPPGTFGWLSLIAALAVTDALRGACELAARLKWPNDVLIGTEDGERKVCGVLAEAVPDPARPAVVIGVGLNVSQTADELPVPTATSLRLAGAATTDRDTVLRAYLRALAVRYRGFVAAGGDAVAAGIAADYRAACSTIGREVEVQQAGRPGVSGRADGVDDDGRLVVLVGGDRRRFAAGDVFHLRGSAAPG
jgi:BirA family biotin operon repressor/biotin-[acetyl-CoA-carboxylase] ligase